ncbi:MAG: FtsW/RodA/SpoVE family cell cycle protein [Pirellulales bacterium]|nr:FtsW/RodA/SpoVE family cell cycle protein [Pirellulales bacterium]
MAALARLPWLLLVSAGLLGAVGLAAIARSEALTGDATNFWPMQLLWWMVAIAAGAALATTSSQLVWRWSYAALAGTLVLLVLVYFFPAKYGAHRWVRLGPVGVQPSELAKITYVLALARYLMYRENYRRLRGLLWPLVLTLVPLVLVLREPDLGTALVFVPLLFAMLWAAGARLRDLAIVALVGLLTLPLLASQMSREQRSRITALAEQSRPGQRPTGDGYHLQQSKQVIALGGIWGSAIAGQWVDDDGAYRLPVSHSDFIFSIVAERFGLVGAGVVLLLYWILVTASVRIAAGTNDPFARLVAAGIATLLAVEVAINTAMTVGLAPVTGLSLPLMSHGGSGLVAHVAALGLLVRIAMRDELDVSPAPFRWSPG